MGEIESTCSQEGALAERARAAADNWLAHGSLVVQALTSENRSGQR
jgi:hypothetical protein